ncbi:MAG: hypothetical protein AMXMBFR4_09430 [Candidatus Hydrogenedentota bacterium]
MAATLLYQPLLADGENRLRLRNQKGVKAADEFLLGFACLCDRLSGGTKLAA